MLGCEIVWSSEESSRAQELIERATGKACPCKRGLTCPLLGWLLEERVQEAVPA